MISAQKLVLPCIGVAMAAGLTAFANSVPDQQIASWTCYYKNTDPGGLFSPSYPWTNEKYTLSVSSGNLVAVDFDYNTNLTQTDTVSLDKIKDIKGENDAGHYYIGIDSFGDDVNSKLAQTDLQNSFISLDLGADETTYSAVNQKLHALANK